MGFETVVVSVAIITLILLLTWIGFGMYKHNHDAKFPPVSSECPDYWKVKGEGKNQECINVKHLGNCLNKKGSDSANFNVPYFEGSQGLCRKADWARRCGITWNGITNAGSKLQKMCGQQ